MTLAEARKLLGISQLELDREAGIARGTTNELEIGRNENPGHATVVRIVRALRRKGLVGASAEDLFPVPESDRDRAVAS